MEDSYLIRGGKKLEGEVCLSGAKNVALKTIIASLLFEKEVFLNNIPQIGDIFELIQLIKQIGGKAKFIDKNKVLVDGRGLSSYKLDFLHSSKIRASFMFFAPLLHKFGEAHVPNPGGCRIGLRPIDRIIGGMKSLGVEVNYNSSTGYYQATMANKPNGVYLFPKPSHTGTELLIMLSVFAKESVIIENAALEPEIDELIRFLNTSGADIQRNNTTIIIRGVSKLVQSEPFTISSDRNEAVTYAILGLVTGGSVVLSQIKEEMIGSFLTEVKGVGGEVHRLGENKWRFSANGGFRSSNILTSPHPGFMTDWQPPWAVLMTQAQGISLIHERIFENRFSYVNELRKLGAKIDFVDVDVNNPKEFYFFNYNSKGSSQAIRISGPKRLHSAVLNISDLRAGATLVLAALVAKGETVVNNASVLERGYEDITSKIQKLGGEIEKV